MTNSLQKASSGLSIAEVARVLHEGAGLDAQSVERVGAGAWSECFGFELDDKAFVVRFGLHGDDFDKDALAPSFAVAGLPIPAVTHRGRTVDLEYAVSERVIGAPIEFVEQWSGVAESVVGLLEGLRIAAIQGSAGWGFWDTTGQGRSDSWRDYLLAVGDDDPTSRVAGWSVRLGEQPKHETVFIDAYRLLERSVVDEVPRSLVHSDLSNRNAHAVDGHVTGVFDWGNSLYGDHLYDLAHFEFWQPWFPHIPQRLLRDLLFERWKSLNYEPTRFADRLATCVLHIGLEHLAYAAFMQNEENFAAVHARMKALVDGL